MQTEIKQIHKDIESIKKSIAVIKHILAENYDLSKKARKQLNIAYKTHLSKYLSQEEVKKKLLR